MENWEMEGGRDSNSEVIQTYHQLIDSGYPEQLPIGSRYREQALWSSSITYLSFAPLTYIRTSAIARTIPDGYCSFIYLMEGEGYWLGSGEHRRLSPGDMIFIYAAKQFSFNFHEDYRVLSFNIPEKQLFQNLSYIPSHGELIKAVNWEKSLYTTLKKHLLKASQYKSGEMKFAERELFTLLNDKLELHRQRRCKEERNNLALVKRLISRYAIEAEFSVQWLLSKTRFSRRYLYKLFEGQSQTLSQCIQEAQLSRAFILLADPLNLHLSIGEIALACGFKTQAHFSRLFKKQFSITPKTVRNKLREAETVF